MPAAPVVITTPDEPLVAGSFTEGPSYHTVRQGGSTDWLLVHTVAGSGYFSGDGSRHFAHAGDFHLLRPRTVHDYGAIASWSLIWTHFLPRNDWMPLLKWPEIAPGLMQLSIPARQCSAARQIFRKIERIAASAMFRRSDLALNALEELLLRIAPQPGSLDHRIEAALERLHSDLAYDHSVPGLAAACGLSTSRFAHLFRQQLGVSPLRYLEERRLIRARQLLDATSFTVAEIAFQVGFQSPFYFSRRFRLFSGLSPSGYRHRQAPIPGK